MKTIFLLRHAKAVLGDVATRDFDRALSKRGTKDALRIGEIMKKQNIEPQMVLTSPAMRTKQTIELALQSSKLEVEPKFNEQIYDASLTDLLNVIALIDEEVNSLLLVGHNPGMEELLRFLTGEVCPLATAAFARIDMENRLWNEVPTHHISGQLVWSIKPN